MRRRHLAMDIPLSARTVPPRRTRGYRRFGVTGQAELRRAGSRTCGEWEELSLAFLRELQRGGHIGPHSRPKVALVGRQLTSSRLVAHGGEIIVGAPVPQQAQHFSTIGLLAAHKLVLQSGKFAAQPFERLTAESRALGV